MKIKKRIVSLILVGILLGQSIGAPVLALADQVEETPSVQSEEQVEIPTQNVESVTEFSIEEVATSTELSSMIEEPTVQFKTVEEERNEEAQTESSLPKEEEDVKSNSRNAQIALGIEYNSSFAGSAYFSGNTYMSGERANFKTALSYSQDTGGSQEVYTKPYIRYVLKKSAFQNVAVGNWPLVGNAGISDKRMSDNPNNSEEIFVDIELTTFAPGSSISLPFYLDTNKSTFRDNEIFTVKQELHTSDGTLLKESEITGIAKTNPFEFIQQLSAPDFYENQTNELGELDDSAKEIKLLTQMKFNGKQIKAQIGIENRLHHWELIVPEGVNIVSADWGGQIVGNKVIWEKTPEEIANTFTGNFYYQPKVMVNYEGAKNNDTFHFDATFSYVNDDQTLDLKNTFPFDQKISIKPTPTMATSVYVKAGVVYNGTYREGSVILTDQVYDFDYRVMLSPRAGNSATEDYTVATELDSVSYDTTTKHGSLKSLKITLNHGSQLLIAEEIPKYSQNIVYGIDANGNRTQIYEDLPADVETPITIQSDKFINYEVKFKTPVKFLNRDVFEKSVTIEFTFDVPEEISNDLYERVGQLAPNKSIGYFNGNIKSTMILLDGSERKSSGTAVNYFSYLGNTVEKRSSSISSTEAYTGSTVQLTEEFSFSNWMGTFEAMDGQTYKQAKGLYQVYLLPTGLEAKTRNNVTPDQIIENYQGSGKNAYFFNVPDLSNTFTTVKLQIYINHNAALTTHKIDSFFYWSEQDYFVGKANANASIELNQFPEIPGSTPEDSLLYTEYQLQVENAEALTTYKLVKEKGADTPYLSTTDIVPGATVTYQIIISNSTSSNFDYIESIDVLPYVGDHRLNNTNELRNSEFSVVLDGPVSGPKGYEVFYSVENQQATYIEDFASSWLTETEATQVGFDKIKKIKIKSSSNTVLSANSQIVFEYDGKIPTEVGIGKLANNSVGTRRSSTEEPVESADNQIKIIKDTSKVTVTATPEDENGDPIPGYPSVEYPGKPGDELEITPPSIPGYELVTKPEELPTTHPNVDTEVPLEYVKVTPIKVTYKDEAGNELQVSTEMSKRVNTAYETDAPATIIVDGKTYVLTATPDNAQGTVGYDAIEVNYVYVLKEIPENTGMVIVRYVNQDGDTLTKEERLFGKLGEVYKTTAKLIPGYVLVATPMNQSGVFTEDTIEVVYVYEKAVTILPDEQTPTDTIDKGKPLDLQKPVNNNSQGAISYIPVKKYSALPKTNSESDIELTLIGLFIVSGLGILFINQRKQKR